MSRVISLFRTSSRPLSGLGFSCFVSCLLLSLASAQTLLEDRSIRRPPNTLLEYNQREYEMYQRQLEYENQRHTVNTDSAFTVLGRWAWGPCRAVEITGHYALIGQGYVYQVLDISNLSAPVIMYDTTLAEPIVHLEIKNSILFVQQKQTVLFLDASQPFPFLERGRLRRPGGLPNVDMAVADTLLYLMIDFGGVVAYSIADLTRPRFLAQFPVAWNTVSSIAAQGNFVYYQTAFSPTYILEYVPGSNAFRDTSISVDYALSSFVSDSLWYVGTYSQLRIYRITNPWQPQLVGSVNVAYAVERMEKQGNMVYAATQDSGMYVINVVNPAQPEVVNRVRDIGWGIYHQLAASGTVLAASHDAGLKLYSIAPPDSIQYRYFFPTGGGAEDIVMMGNIGIVSHGTGGIWSVDFSDPTHPQPIANYPVEDGKCHEMTSKNGLVFTLCSRSHLRDPFNAFVEITRLGADGRLIHVSRTNFRYSPTTLSIAASDTLLFVGTRDSILIFSTANPQSLRQLGVWIAGNSADIYMSAQGHHLFLARKSSISGGFDVLDISDPSHPTQVAHLFTNAFGVLASDTVAYSFIPAGLGGQLVTVNISTPSLPRTLDSVNVPASSPLPIKSGRFLYWAGGGVAASDVSDPARLGQVVSYSGSLLAFSRRLRARSDTLFVPDYGSGVSILKHNILTSVRQPEANRPLEYRLFQNYPNPFNASTTISYELLGRSHIQLEIFDLLGRKVATIIDEVRDAGSYTYAWNAANISSGVYFVRFSAQKIILTNKIVLIR